MLHKKINIYKYLQQESRYAAITSLNSLYFLFDHLESVND